MNMIAATVSMIGQIRLSRIAFHTDMANKHGSVIPLGVIAEITVDKIHGLGLIARSNLDPDELKSIGGMLRQRISAPFDFLKDDFNWAWDNTPVGECLNRLAEKHRFALRFETPSLRRVNFRSEKCALKVAQRKLCDARDKDFELFMGVKDLPPIGDLNEFKVAA